MQGDHPLLISLSADPQHTLLWMDMVQPQGTAFADP